MLMMQKNIIKAMIAIKKNLQRTLPIFYWKIVFLISHYPLYLYEFPYITTLELVHTQATFPTN